MYINYSLTSVLSAHVNILLILLVLVYVNKFQIDPLIFVYFYLVKNYKLTYTNFITVCERLKIKTKLNHKL